jgi:hypothetical protein
MKFPVAKNLSNTANMAREISAKTPYSAISGEINFVAISIPSFIFE